MMKTSFKRISALLVITIVAAGSVALMVMSSTTMQWQVSEGDTLSFAVEVEGFVRVFDPSNGSIWNDSEAPYWYLNGSSFTVKINDLPALASDFTSDTFVDRVIEHTKTSLISPIELVNNTELPSEDYLFLNDLISHSILPVGGWTSIDGFYPDTTDMYQCDTYLSSSGLSTFSIGYRTYNIDAGHGWNATLNMSTGVPFQATVWASQFYGSTWFSYSIRVTLISG
nr:MAG: hypothetical protein AM325_12510 [Candidatus Thorarchaeota archaeon SMTZ1-45]